MLVNCKILPSVELGCKVILGIFRYAASKQLDGLGLKSIRILEDFIKFALSYIVVMPR